MLVTPGDLPVPRLEAHVAMRNGGRGRGFQVSRVLGLGVGALQRV